MAGLAELLALQGLPPHLAQQLALAAHPNLETSLLNMPGGSLHEAHQWAAQAMFSAATTEAHRLAMGYPEEAQDEELSEELNTRPNKRGKSNSGNGSQADYAVRHQAAEQRRRARINERLEALRKLVPHDPRSNTASFLEDVIKHVIMLKDTNERLEQALLASHPGVQGMAAAAAAAAAAARGVHMATGGAVPPSRPASQAVTSAPALSNAQAQPHGTTQQHEPLLASDEVQQALLTLQHHVANGGGPREQDIMVHNMFNGKQVQLVGIGGLPAQQQQAGGGGGTAR